MLQVQRACSETWRIASSAGAQALAGWASGFVPGPADESGQTILEYRIVGIVWGGARVVDRLAIRFNDGQPWEPFDVCPAPSSTRTWSLWSYRWKPSAPGVYSIALRVPDASVPQRRLDSGYYVRQVSIDEV